MRADRRQIPYNPALPAGPEVFVGRETLKRQLLEGLERNGSYWVAGGQGMGKTSLLCALQRQLEIGSATRRSGNVPVPVYVDCSRDDTNVEAIFLVIVNGILTTLREKRKLPFTAQLEDQARAHAGRRRLDTALTLLLDYAYAEEKQSRSIVLLIDNLQRLSGASWRSLASILQTIVNQRRQDLALLLASRNRMPPEIDGPSPLLALTMHEVLGPLDRKETGALVSSAAESGWRVDAGCADRAYELTAGHPYRLHYYLYTALSAERRLTRKGLEGVHGTDWDREIESAIKNARLAILLISANFLNSKFILTIDQGDSRVASTPGGAGAANIPHYRQALCLGPSGMACEDECSSEG